MYLDSVILLALSVWAVIWLSDAFEWVGNKRAIRLAKCSVEIVLAALNFVLVGVRGLPAGWLSLLLGIAWSVFAYQSYRTAQAASK